MKIAVLPQDDKSRSKPFYSLLVGLGYTQHISIILSTTFRLSFLGLLGRTGGIVFFGGQDNLNSIRMTLPSFRG